MLLEDELLELSLEPESVDPELESLVLESVDSELASLEPESVELEDELESVELPVVP